MRQLHKLAEQGQTTNETVLGGQLGIVQDILYTHPL